MKEKYWRAHFRDSNGKRVRISFQAENREFAAEHAEHCVRSTTYGRLHTLDYLGLKEEFDADDFGMFTPV